jgi:hypothetical protein
MFQLLRRKHTSEDKNPHLMISIASAELAKRRYSLFGFLSLCLLACTPLYLILADGVHVPFGDEYSLLTLLAGIRTDHASFKMFWAPHNEHRIFIPRMLFSMLIRPQQFENIFCPSCRTNSAFTIFLVCLFEGSQDNLMATGGYC